MAQNGTGSHQVQLRQWKLATFDIFLPGFIPLWCGWREVIIGLGNGLAPNRRQAIILINGYSVQRRRHAALWRDVLRRLISQSTDVQAWNEQTIKTLHCWSFALGIHWLPTQGASNAERLSMPWYHHELLTHWLWYVHIIFRILTDLYVILSYQMGHNAITYVPIEYTPIFVVLGLVVAMLWVLIGFMWPICMMTSSNGNIFRVTGRHLWGEFTGHRSKGPRIDVD